MIPITFKYTNRLGDGNFFEGLSASSYIDEDITNYTAYTYRISDVDASGIITVKANIDISIADEISPLSIELLNPYPNPFNPMTNIFYKLSEDAQISLSVVDVLGRTIQTIISGQKQKAGSYSIFWNGKNQNGSMASSGVYVFVLKAGSVVKTQKVMLMR